MALIIRVYQMNLGRLQLEGSWENGREWEEQIIDQQPGMTAAESAEFYMLEQGMAASWMWTKHKYIGHSNLVGQFVHAGGHKEVAYSRAHEYDL